MTTSRRFTQRFGTKNNRTSKMIEFDGRVAFEDRAELPTASGVYFFQDSRDKVLYVGQSLNIKNRVLTHHRLKQLEGVPGAFIGWLIVDNVYLSERENQFINELSPSWNYSSAPGTATAKLSIEEKEQAQQKAGDIPLSVIVRRLIQMWLEGEIEIKI